MKLLFAFALLFTFTSCDDDQDIVERNRLIIGSWNLESQMVNEEQSDNIRPTILIFNEDAKFSFIEASDTSSGTWDLTSFTNLRINWDDETVSNYKILRLNSQELVYEFYLDSGTGFPQLLLTNSFIKSKSSG